MKPQLPDDFKLTKKDKQDFRKFYNKARTILNVLKYFAGGIAIGLAVIILNKIWGWLR